MASSGSESLRCVARASMVGDAGDRVSRFRFVSLGISKPLHGRGIHTHRRLANNLKISRHAGEPLIPCKSRLMHLVGVREVRCDFYCSVFPFHLSVPLAVFRSG
jgi:hypothetical protein